jgi:hypothetical protein
VDTHNSVIYWNPAAEDLLGWKREEVLGRAVPFDGDSELMNNRGRRVEAAIWSAPVHSSTGSISATLFMAASRSALRGAVEARPGSRVSLAPLVEPVRGGS